MTAVSTMEATRDAFGAELLECAKHDPSIVVVDADLGNAIGLVEFRATFPERYIQVGIAEQNAVGVAAGLAACGFRPVMTSFAAFIACRSLDQIRVSVAQTGLPVVLVGGHSGLLAGRLGKTHVAMEDLAILRSLPKLTCVAPADAVEMRQALRACLMHPGPTYLRVTRDATPNFFDNQHSFVIGPAFVLREGEDISIFSSGTMTPLADKVADLLAERGYATTVVHVPTLKPLDGRAVWNASQGRRLVVTYEDHSILGGLGSAVAEVLCEGVHPPLLRIGTDDTYIDSGRNDDLMRDHRLEPDVVADRIISALEVK